MTQAVQKREAVGSGFGVFGVFGVFAIRPD